MCSLEWQKVHKFSVLSGISQGSILGPFVIFNIHKLAVSPSTHVAQPLLLLQCGRPYKAYFSHFVTFSTKHGSTSDKACSHPFGSCYVHDNAHRRPRAIFEFLPEKLPAYRIIYQTDDLPDLPELCAGQDPSSEIFLYGDDSKIYKVIRNQSDQQKLLYYFISKWYIRTLDLQIQFSACIRQVI